MRRRLYRATHVRSRRSRDGGRRGLAPPRRGEGGCGGSGASWRRRSGDRGRPQMLSTGLCAFPRTMGLHLWTVLWRGVGVKEVPGSPCGAARDGARPSPSASPPRSGTERSGPAATGLLGRPENGGRLVRGNPGGRGRRRTCPHGPEGWSSPAVVVATRGRRGATPERGAEPQGSGLTIARGPRTLTPRAFVLSGPGAPLVRPRGRPRGGVAGRRRRTGSRAAPRAPAR